MRTIMPLILLLFLIGLFLNLGATESMCQSKGIAEIIYVSGIAKIKTPSSGDWVDVQEGMIVKEGDIIKTEADSNVELAFGEGLSNIINIFPNSQLVISRFTPGLVKLEEGRVFSLLKKLKKGSSFEVRTPTAVAGARGTGWGVNLEDNGTDVQGFEKTVYVAGLDDKGGLLGLANLTEGWKTFLGPGEGPAKFLQLSEDEKNFWLIWKTGALNHLRDFKKRKIENQGSGSQDEKGNMEKLDHRAKILERVERETERIEQIKRDRRSGSSTSGEGQREYKY